MPNPAADGDQPTGPAAPYDALLLVSFGGPEGQEDVVPFLENVTRGRGIPRERLEEVGEHYRLFGGRSPINDQNRDFIAVLEEALAVAGLDLPVYWGNRNWDPYLADAVRRMSDDGVRRAACFVTSAYSSWSGCRQYRENLFDAVSTGADGAERAPRLDKLRHYFNHPGFVDAMVDRTLAALGDLPGDVHDDARLVFVTHSIPVEMDRRSGPPDGDGGLYTAQHRDVAAAVTARVAEATGSRREHDLVFCSRSGSPRTPWLEPDVNDHLEALEAAGTRAAVLVPVGFVSDHMEVVFDLDTEALETARELGVPCTRAGTAGTHPSFVAAVVELVLERAAAERGEDPERPALGQWGPSWDVCPAGCCSAAAPGESDRPALCGVDSPPVPRGVA